MKEFRFLDEEDYWWTLEPDEVRMHVRGHEGVVRTFVFTETDVISFYTMQVSE